MEKEMLKYFKIIGELQSVIAKANTLDEALKESLKAVLRLGNADYAIIYYKDREETLHPYYWIFPNDFTLRQYKKGEGIVGSAFESGETFKILDYKNNAREDLNEKFKGIDVSSYICVAIANKDENVGAIEFIKEKGEFTSDEADILEIVSTMATLQIEDNEKFKQTWDTGKTIISISDVKKEYQNGELITQVLKGVNLNIYEGEFIALLGESGCGKSTLLNIVGGMNKATSGSVIFEGQDLCKASLEELTKYRRDNIGFIFQSYNLMPNLNVKQNLDLISELVKEPMDSIEALKLVGLDAKQNNYPNQLSGGQQQRVSIARALVKNPKIIMADEPTAALDYETSIEVLEALENICKSGTTLIMVTHNEEITKMADRVVRMRNGKIYEVTVNLHPVKAKQLVW